MSDASTDRPQPQEGTLGFRTMQAWLSAIPNRLRFLEAALGSFRGRRNIWRLLGYQTSPEFDDYYVRYALQDIAKRIVDAPAFSTWREPPRVADSDNELRETAFERSWDALVRDRQALHYLDRVDAISGIGRYGVMFYGLADSLRPDQPAGTVDGVGGLMYLSLFTERNARILDYVTDPLDPRFGLPLNYELTIDPTNLIGRSRSTSPNGVTSRFIAHHSRVLHVATDCLEDDVFGTPRLQGVMARLHDLDKVIGGTSEAIWNTGNRGIHWDVDKDVGSVGEKELKKFAEQIDEMENGNRRNVRTQGVTATVLGSDVPDPSGAFGAITALISAHTGIPKRMLLGLDEGRTAAVQDERSWGLRVAKRRRVEIAPRVLRPFIDAMRSFGVLPDVDSYTAGWPDHPTLNASERAQVAERLARANKAFAEAQNAGDTPMTVDEFREGIGLSRRAAD